MNLPISPAAQRFARSEYKGHNRMKTLVGITPSGFSVLCENCGVEVPVTENSL